VAAFFQIWSRVAHSSKTPDVPTLTNFQNVFTVTPGVLSICIGDRVVKLPVIYVGGKLPVIYRPLPARMGHRALVLKGVGQSLGPMTVIITR